MQMVDKIRQSVTRGGIIQIVRFKPGRRQRTCQFGHAPTGPGDTVQQKNRLRHVKDPLIDVLLL